MSSTPTITAILGALLLCSACGIISGVDKYEVVDCPSGNCSDGGIAASDSSTPGASDADAASDASVAACPAGQVRITIEVASGVGANVTFESLTVAPGETKSTCVAQSAAADLRAETEPSRVVKWAGIACDDGPTGDRCDFRTTVDVTITVSP